MPSSLFSSGPEPRVLQFALQDETTTGADGHVALLYLRVTAKLSVFLKQDTAQVSEDGPPVEADASAAAARDAAANGLEHRYVELKHPLINSSAAAFHPERDVVWFSHETADDPLKELSSFYGPQLDAIQNVLFEGGSWDDVAECARYLRFFKGVRVVYVWLESYRFSEEGSSSTKEDYLKMAQKYKERDGVALKGRNLTVEYIDYQGNVYGGLKTDV